MVTKLVTELELVGGHPALDFANTVEGPLDGDPDVDHLREPSDLVGLGAIRRRPRQRAGGRRGRARPRAHTARRDLRRLPIGRRGREPPAEALQQLAAFYAEAIANARLAPASGRFELTWDGDDPARVLWPLAVAAVDLLRTGPLDHLKVCVECCWLFLDRAATTAAAGAR